MRTTLGYLEVVVERAASELRRARIYPRSAGAHVRFPEQLDRERRRRARIESLSFAISIGIAVLLIVLGADAPHS